MLEVPPRQPVRGSRLICSLRLESLADDYGAQKGKLLCRRGWHHAAEPQGMPKFTRPGQITPDSRTSFEQKRKRPAFASRFPTVSTQCAP
jgi:hypothetical protein